MIRCFSIPLKAEFQKQKLDSLLANYKDSHIHVQIIHHPTQVCVVHDLCKRDVYSAWEQVQQCFVHVTPVYYKEKNEEQSQDMLDDDFIEENVCPWRWGNWVGEPKKFSRNRTPSRKKSTTATCLAKEYSFKDCASTTDFKPLDPNVSDYGQENVKSPVAFIARNTCIKERIEFKDESVGCLMFNSAIHLQKQRAAAVSKGAKLSVLNESPCYGFLVEGTPKEVPSRKKSTTPTHLAKEYSFKDCTSITDFKPLDPNVSGYGQENVESPVAFIARNTCIKERIEFKDESVGCLMINSAIHLQKQRAAAVCKGAKLSVLNESPCYGFLVEGTPKEVKEVIQSISQYYESLMKNGEEVNFRQIILKSFYSPVCSAEKIAECKENLMNKFYVSSSFSLVSDEWLDDVTIRQAFLSLTTNHVVNVKIVVGKLGMQKTDAIVIPTDRVMEEEGVYPVQLP